MADSNTPKVSVCIPVFNAADYLRQAVESALGQDIQDFEIVIVDNCSTDHTASLVSELQQLSNGRIRFYQNDHNIGLVGNLNRCLEYAKGAYIKFLCADDMLLPGCLGKMASGLDLHQPVKLVSCSRLVIDVHGNKLGEKRYMAGDTVVDGKQVITRCLFGGNYIGEPTAVMFRKSDLKGRFREDMPQLSDMDMWFQLLEQGDLLGMEEPLCAIRSHAAQMTHANVKLGMLIEDNIKLFEAYSHKSYLEATWLLILQHKLLMTYRVWVSRKSISGEKRKMVLDRYASQLAYTLMPMVERALYLKNRIVGARKTRHRN